MITKMSPKLVDRKVYRGAQPNGLADFVQLKRSGITQLLDLETGEWMDGSRLYELEMAREAGVCPWSIPMSRVTPPTRVQLENAANWLNKWAATGIYVHCRDGVDRTGMVVAKYRMRFCGWTKEKAVEEMKAEGMHFWYYWWAWWL